jgi:hypothetical protein
MPPMGQHAALRNPTAFTPTDLLRVLGHELRNAYDAEGSAAVPQDLRDLIEGLRGPDPVSASPDLIGAPGRPNPVSTMPTTGTRPSPARSLTSAIDPCLEAA